MNIRLIRHATLILTINGSKVLVDPMLGSKGAYAPIPSRVIKRNPVIELPITKGELEDIINEIDMVLLTHTHNDHFDKTAHELLPREIPVICQPEDEEKLKQMGFTKVYSVNTSLLWNGIKLIRTGGQHGTGKIAEKMAPVSGFVVEAPEEPSLYIAGDTVWCDEVESALGGYNPSIVVLNMGSARFLTGDPITMGTSDIQKVCQKSKEARIVAVHMETMNHCGLCREELKKFLIEHNLDNRVDIPADGEEISL